MMNMKKYNNSLDSEILLTFEQYAGFKFPNDYREFLLKYNGGDPEFKYFDFANDKNDGSVLHYLFGFVPYKDQNILCEWKDYIDRIPKNTFPIAPDTFGNLILISVKGPDRGKIYFWDHEMEAGDGEEPDYSNLTLIADSFDEFFNSLHDFELDEES